ncbi:MAG: Asp-tRNA(Asn)/Glu-tRNA(Gln) amidotransferase subunit GatA [Chloroflexota bacterium]
MDYSIDRAKLLAGETTCLELTQNALSEIKQDKTNSFITIIEEKALDQARACDARIAAGKPLPLDGMLVAVKDNISTRGVRTTCGSRILENFKPVYDATVVERLTGSGAIVVGKTNMDEFAMGSSNETSYFGVVRHPLDPEYVPGGSSGGSAAAVASKYCHVALGSDTGGSIRQPAAFCGVVGLKPTYGRVSRYGLVAFASSLDQIGPISSSIEDSAAMFDAISGVDKSDSTTAPMAPANSFTKLNGEIPESFKFGVLPADVLSNCSKETLDVYNACIDKIKSQGGEPVEIVFANPETWIPTYYILATAEASSNLARFDGMRYGFRAECENGENMMARSRSEGFGEEVKRRIMLGTYALSSGYYDAYYKKAQQSRRLIYNSYKSAFEKVEFIFMPTTPSTAFKIGEKVDNPVEMYLSDFFTTSANLAGIPAVSVPCGNAPNGFSVGMQLQCNHFEEGKMLRYAKLLDIMAK